MPLKKRGQAWQVTICFGGQVYRKQSRRWSRAQAAEYERFFFDEIHAQQIGKVTPRSFAEGVERYEADELPRMRPRTQAEARKNLSYIAKSHDGKMLADAEEVAGDIRKRFAHLSAATVNRRLQIVNRIVNLAWKNWKWLPSPIAIPMLPEKEHERFLTRAEVERLAKACPKSGDFIRLLAYTGIRKSQALGLTAQSVKGGFLHLGRDGKSGKPQLVPIHPKLRRIVKRLPLPVTLGILHKEWYAARVSTGIQARIHDLRHTHASWLLQSGADLIAVRDLLGHSSVAVTQRYAHLAAQHLRRAVNRI